MRLIVKKCFNAIVNPFSGYLALLQDQHLHCRPFRHPQQQLVQPWLLRVQRVSLLSWNATKLITELQAQLIKYLLHNNITIMVQKYGSFIKSSAYEKSRMLQTISISVNVWCNNQDFLAIKNIFTPVHFWKSIAL